MRLGDVLCIDWDASKGRLVFHKESEGAVLPVAAPQPQVVAQAAEASSGRTVEVPSTALAGSGSRRNISRNFSPR